METPQEVAESCPPLVVLKPHCPGGCWRNWEALRRIYWRAAPRYPKEAPYLLAAVVVNKTQRINKQALSWELRCGGLSLEAVASGYTGKPIPVELCSPPSIYQGSGILAIPRTAEIPDLLTRVLKGFWQILQRRKDRVGGRFPIFLETFAVFPRSPYQPGAHWVDHAGAELAGVLLPLSPKS